MENNLHLYNTLSGKKEKFEPLHSPHVGMYVCGPTVYSDVHLGNVRTFLSFDVIFRYLKYIGFDVRYVRNITDVGHLVGDIDEGEDKIAKKARLENLEPMEIVQKYTNGFHDVMRMFNIQEPSIEPSATGHIIEQIEMVQEIIKNGFAYEVNGSVYFDVKKYNETNDYGKLSGRKIEDLLSNTRELDGQSEKRESLDFALWKKAEKGHIMRWNSPWGIGFPGWHLECSVMSTKYLGQQFDIHGGGMDLKFPHHECEISQNIGATGIDPVKYWLHTNMLTVNGGKMSKSDGTGFSPEQLLTGGHELLDQGYSAMTVRFFMLQGHYASTLDFSNAALKAAEKGYKKLTTAIKTLSKLKVSDTSDFDVASFKKKSLKAMDDDFNTPVLISVLFEGVKFINSVKDGLMTITAEDLIDLSKTFNEIMVNILGFKEEQDNASGGEDLSGQLIELLIRLRKDAKKNNNYALSDKIREELTELKVQIKDSREGTTWEVVS